MNFGLQVFFALKTSKRLNLKIKIFIRKDNGCQRREEDLMSQDRQKQ
jgi:hypothetical protein